MCDWNQKMFLFCFTKILNQAYLHDIYIWLWGSFTFLVSLALGVPLPLQSLRPSYGPRPMMLCLCHCRCDFLHSFKLVFIIAVLVKYTRCGNFTPNWWFLEVNWIQIGLPTSFPLHKEAHPTGWWIVNFKIQAVHLQNPFSCAMYRNIIFFPLIQ